MIPPLYVHSKMTGLKRNSRLKAASQFVSKLQKKEAHSHHKGDF
ncbi:hypothetical protein HMPREF1246_0208 [Acidaminococcus sp. BV3L6]|uniref:Uncharacterized protein n=1 Tax=Acidaminococcus intestini (strain RyC-MR95) TaxID=568816 RepID=G4Q6P5_ACIIR|nr:hypothetical protein Acin_0144 [Acidaminococcus intestini RyC-MR95]ERL17845.1 hypothetical protein HMPREF1246_0208 [Acidaminococcus sp. BV3L6]